MTTGWHPIRFIRLSFYFEMTTGWRCHMNQIGSVVELKIYIKVQEEDIRVQEEFVATRKPV